MTLAGDKFTFTSLVPTHYIMMLGPPEAAKHRHNAESVAKLLISSAPAHKDTKLALMEYFSRSKLYARPEAGWATLLRPEEQLIKLGSIGRECLGTARIKLRDPDGAEVADGEVGGIYSRTPYAFRGYRKSPAKTVAAFRGEYCSVKTILRERGHPYMAFG
jgi:fatty-acyl-CoA synthase